MPYKFLQQLKDEQQAHHKKALQLLQEATEIFKLMKVVNPLSDESLKLHDQWVAKYTKARTEIEKSIQASKHFVQELERLKKRSLN